MKALTITALAYKKGLAKRKVVIVPVPSPSPHRILVFDV